LEASRVLAQRLLNQKLTDDQRIESAFRKILCRKPTAKEKILLMEYHQKELARYKADKDRAKRFVQIGEFPIEGNPEPSAHAALMQLIHTFYNLEETSTKS
jgi:hypothetical protein